MRPLLSTVTTTLLSAAVVASGAALAPAQADDEPLPDGRHVRHYTVKPGDTATELAVRFHAWTAELIDHNHLGATAGLVVGQRIEIPVVTSAVPHRKPRADRRHKADRQRHADRARRSPAHDRVRDPSRQRVRRAILRTARIRGIDPQLALAVSWQEAGWQMHHTSSAGAIGAMQVLPTTAAWMEWYVGRDLHPRRLRDNVATGVTLLGVLNDFTRSRRHQVGAYYQGLGAVQDDGLYDETHRYVDNVLAIKHRLERGLPPA